MKDYKKELLIKKRWGIRMTLIVLVSLAVYGAVSMIDMLIGLVALIFVFAADLFIIVNWYNEGDKTVTIDCRSSYSYIDITNADERKKLNDKYAVVYLETTGDNYKRERIIDIGAVKVENGKIVEKFATHVNPEICLPSDVAAATGLTDAILAKAPKAKPALKKLVSFIGGLPVVGHDAGFDFDFVIMAIEKAQYSFKLIDTLALSKKVFKDLDSYKLLPLAAALGIEHGDTSAIGNAITCKALFEKCLEKL